MDYYRMGYRTYLGTSLSMRKTTNALVYLLLIGSAGIAVLSQNWSNLFVISIAIILSLVPYILRKKYDIKLSKRLSAGILLFLFSTILLGEVNHFYEKFTWWDTVLHFTAGLGLTVFGFVILHEIYSNSQLRSTPKMTAFFAFCFTGMMAGVWEIFEFSVDTFVKSANMQPSNADTMQDLIVALMAAVIVCYFGFRHLKYRERNLTGQMVESTKINRQ